MSDLSIPTPQEMKSLIVEIKDRVGDNGLDDKEWDYRDIWLSKCINYIMGNTKQLCRRCDGNGYIHISSLNDKTPHDLQKLHSPPCARCSGRGYIYLLDSGVGLDHPNCTECGRCGCGFLIDSPSTT